MQDKNINRVCVFILVSAAACTLPSQIPGPLKAGWQGKAVCEKVRQNLEQQVLRCTFPPGVGHERHSHRPHFGFVLAGGVMQVTDANGTRTIEVTTGSSFESAGIEWHEALNVGTTTTVFMIFEDK